MTKEEAIQQLNIEKDSLRRLVIDCGITELKPKFEAISMAIEALSAESSRKWETCFSCPLAKGCPQIQGKSNDEIAKYASEIPNGCPLSMLHDNDLISRADAIERVELITKCEWDNNVIYRDEVIDALKFAPSAEETGAMDDAIVKYVKDGWMKLPSTDKPTNTPTDLISRADAIEAVGEAIADGASWYDALNALTSAEAEWIPCSERLPKTGDSVLATYSDGEVDIIWSARPKVWVTCSERNNLIYPIAWMSLPKPYKESEVEE